MNEPRRDVVVGASAASMTIEGPVRFNHKFTWRVIYLRMCRRLNRLRSMYDSGSIELSAAYAEFDSFFLDVNHLQDWFEKDTESEYALPQDVRSQVGSWVAKSKALTIAEGYSNTNKHFKRKRDTQMHARICAGVMSADYPLIVVVEVEVGGDTTYECAAMPLAEACARDWEAFLVKHGVEVPVP